MGAVFSKSATTASGAAQAAKRQYPTRVPTPRGPVAPTARPAPASARAATAPPPTQSPCATDPSTAGAEKETAAAAAAPEPAPAGFDPQLGAALRELGPVRPAPTLSHSSTFAADPTVPLAAAGPTGSPALRVLEARRALAARADAEHARAATAGPGFEGREFLDVGLLGRAVEMRGQGTPDGEIERSLGLKAGVVARLGPWGLLGTVEST